MKNRLSLFLLLLGGLALRSDDCGTDGPLSCGNEKDNNPTHETQIIVTFGSYHGGGDKADVLIDGVSAGILEGNGSVVKKGLTEGDHTISAQGLIKSSENWPAVTIALLAGQTLTHKLNLNPVKLTITPSLTCEQKNILKMNADIIFTSGSTITISDLAPGVPGTIDSDNGILKIKLIDSRDGRVVHESFTPFLAGGESHSVVCDCQ